MVYFFGFLGGLALFLYGMQLMVMVCSVLLVKIAENTGSIDGVLIVE
ncbi:MAG: hypothetical protein ACLR2G_03485 [Phascolarctobacterium faecium]